MSHFILRKFLFCTVCVFAGWIAAFAMPPVSLWPCMFVGLSALYILYSRTTSGPQAFAAGFFFALGYFVTGLWWIGNALLVEGNEFAWVWPISVIGLPTLLGLFTGTYLACARMIAAPNTVKGFLAFVFFLTFSEWARGHAFTGFPWNLYGYVWADHLAMAQATHFIGAYGLTLVSILWAALGGFLYLSPLKSKTKIATATAAILSLVIVYAGGQARLSNNETELDMTNGLVVVQPNIPQDMKWDPVALQNNFEKIVSLSRGATFASPQPKNIFVVWPETAISPTVYTVPENMESISAMLNSYTASNAYLVTGVLLRRGETKEDMSFSNSVTILDKTMAALDTYDKSHLVPFGEFIPFQKWIPLKPVVAFKGFEPGKGAKTIQSKDIPPFSPLICYEVIFPDDVTGKPRPQWIVNVTNDGWYGDSAGPYQHFAQTRLRAIEEGLPVVRSANTGISGIIDPYGRVIDQADIFHEAAIVSYLPKPAGGLKIPLSFIIQMLLPIAALSMLVKLLISKK